MDADLPKLDPQRFSNMSLPMAAILGFLLERQFTTPALADVLLEPLLIDNVAGHLVVFAAFLVQAHPQSGLACGTRH